MMPRGVVPALALLLLSTVLAPAQDEEAPRRHPKPAAPVKVAAPSAPSEDRALLRQLADAQRALGEQMQQLQEKIEELRGEVAKEEDSASVLQEEIKATRDEVKGLYVESSTVKQQIDALKDDVGGVNSNVSGFRTFSGFFIAVMLMLLAVIFVLTIRR